MSKNFLPFYLIRNQSSKTAVLYVLSGIQQAIDHAEKSDCVILFGFSGCVRQVDQWPWHPGSGPAIVFLDGIGDLSYVVYRVGRFSAQFCSY